MIPPAAPPFGPKTAPAFAGRFLSNGRYHLLMTPFATGYSQWGTLRLSAWSADRTADAEGSHVWLQEPADGTAWRLGGTDAPASASYRSDGRIDLAGEKNDIEWRLAVAVLPGADAELRRLVLRNRSDHPRNFVVRTVTDVVLHEAQAHASHPTFSRLFLQTDVEPGLRLLLAARRPRSPEESYPAMFQVLHGGSGWRWETDRARLVGRRLPGELPRFAMAEDNAPGTAGSVLDPVLSQAARVTLAPGEARTIDILVGVTAEREEARRLAEQAAVPAQVAAWIDEAREMEEARRMGLECDRADADYFEAVAGAILAGVPSLGDLSAPVPGPHINLAPFALDGRCHLALHDPASELPEEASHARGFDRMARYWNALGLPIQSIRVRATSGTEDGAVPRDITATEDERMALRHRAALVLREGLPTLAYGVMETDRSPAATPSARRDVTSASDEVATSVGQSRGTLTFDNGHGGFAADGREYVIRMERRSDGTFRRTPLPWTNVLANENFGCIVSETGAGVTWSRNSREYRLTPWSNDPLLDVPGECFYVRDEATGRFGSPLPGPAPWSADYEMRHAPGVSRAHVTADGLDMSTDIFVVRHDPVRVTRIRITERNGTARRLSVYAAARLVLGHAPEDSGRFVTTAAGPSAGSLTATTRRGGDVTGRVAVAGVVTTDARAELSIGGDRATFQGVHGTLAAPRAVVSGEPLDGRTGPGLDPMFGQRAVIDLPAGGTVEVAFLLGDAASHAEARGLLERYQDAADIEAARKTSDRWWREELGGLSIETPSPALDLMVNHWLPYQTVACRLWGRSAFYQSGGAFGFRDQLQDSMSLLLLRPAMAREQLLRNAAHQFPEGDVLHWWHPPLGAGIRTRFADDRLWLPLFAAEYVAATGDESLLDEMVPWVTARALEAGEDEAYLRSTTTDRADTLYEHCLRAIEISLETGAHGLPLFGTGDWNDGMNRVGREGRGESVWMGFFLYKVLGDFLPYCERKGDEMRVQRYRLHRERLREALEQGGWDGAWYRRGYYDNGTPLGSCEGEECRIDALAQAWAVLSGAASPERARQAMENCRSWLVSEDEGLIRLLTPPFDRTIEDPGYIKGYVAGVRENGGQYTHAALWVVRAMAELGRNDLAARWLDLLNPVHHSATAADVERYRVEPYVVAADVYGAPPHVGRGGWTWYTGSAGWMYRVAVESILGLEWRDGKHLVLRPCLPDDWKRVTIRWRPPGGLTRYTITLMNPRGAGLGVGAATIDGVAIPIVDGAAHLDLATDGLEHHVLLETGATEAAPVPAS
ncbi:MAG TPA: glycosyl transferase [Candidatus Eisenbacteria bacterium]